jgi:hypothetical protein
MHRRMYPKIEATARHGARKENAKVRNRRHQKKVRLGQVSITGNSNLMLLRCR